MARILVADDHDPLRRGLALALAAAGHDVEEAANGNAAIERLLDLAALAMLGAAAGALSDRGSVWVLVVLMFAAASLVPAVRRWGLGLLRRMAGGLASWFEPGSPVKGRKGPFAFGSGRGSFASRERSRPPRRWTG